MTLSNYFKSKSTHLGILLGHATAPQVFYDLFQSFHHQYSHQIEILKTGKNSFLAVSIIHRIFSAFPAEKALIGIRMEKKVISIYKLEDGERQ